jgi:hypothetical protein
LINLSVFIYSFYFGWNNAIYFDNEKVWRKIKGKRYEWYWEDMESCDIYWERQFFRSPTIVVEITAKSNCERLKFEFSHCKKLIEICPNETVREEFKKAVEKFHIRLWW